MAWLLNDRWRPDIRDIADSLSKLCRYGGHGRFYSVAQHSVLVSRLCPTLEALLHDAHEAYIGDIASPVKWAIEAIAPNSVAELDRRIAGHVRRSFGVQPTTSPECKAADHKAMAIEYPVVFEGRALKTWRKVNGIEPDYSVPLVLMDSVDARTAFLARFVELTGYLPERRKYED